jgi:capsid protein
MNLLARIWNGVRRSPQSTMQVRRFQAARIDRLAADWLGTQQSINEELRGDLDRLRARGRDLANNNDYARKFRDMVQNNIIGPAGIRLQVRIEDSPGKPDRLANMAIESAWREWQYVADLTGHQHFRDMCETLTGGLTCDGEFKSSTLTALTPRSMAATAPTRSSWALRLTLTAGR